MDCIPSVLSGISAQRGRRVPEASRVPEPRQVDPEEQRKQTRAAWREGHG